MKATLSKIKPIRSDLIPPEGSVAAGTTPDGRQLYRRVKKVVVKGPKLDKDGNRVWKKNPLNAEPLLPVNTVEEIRDEDELFILVDQLNGNVEKVPYRHPTPEELAYERRKLMVASAKDELAEAIVDAGLTPKEAIARLLGEVKTPPVVQTTTTTATGTPADITDAVVYPRHIGGPKWELSDFTFFVGNRADATDAEKRVTDEMRAAAREARTLAQGLPEE